MRGLVGKFSALKGWRPRRVLACEGARVFRGGPGAHASAPYVALALAAYLGLLGCVRSSVSRGTELYEQKRYIDAAWVFEGMEVELARYDAEERASYGFYRGATLWLLGDVEHARRWLEYGARAARALPTAERAALVRAVLGPSPVSALERALAAPVPDAGIGGGIIAAESATGTKRRAALRDGASPSAQ